MKASRFRTVLLAAGAALSLAGGVALAQQPPGAQPQPVQPQPRPFPGNHPPVPGMPGQPGMNPHGGGQGRPPVVIGPDGRPQGMPGSRPNPNRPGRPGRPGAPPGFNPRPQPHSAPHEEEHAGGGEHACPGHGPEDPPPHVNLWHGLLMVNNERAQRPDFLNQLLFRYENPKDPCDAKNEPPPFLASLLNFGILAFILYRFGRKPLAEALVKRKQEIMAEIETATKIKEDAEARLEEYEDNLENIEAKLAEVRAEYAAQAEVEKKHLLAEAEERRVRMRRDAEFRVEQERKAARDELLREAVVAATAAAEELVRKQISRADHDRMATDYLAAVGKALAPTRATGAQA